MQECIRCWRESRSAVFCADYRCTPFHPTSHDLSNVVSAAKRRIGSSDDETPNRAFVNGLRCRFDSGVHLIRECISLFGPVESQNSDLGSITVSPNREPNISPSKFSRHHRHFAPKIHASHWNDLSVADP
jgi:hypothetical protein